MTKQDLWKQAVDFIESQKPILLKKIKKYKAYSTGLETEDFLQEARIAAFETAEETLKKCCQNCGNTKCSMCQCTNFQKIFWGKLKSRFYQPDLTDIPSEYRLYKNSQKTEEEFSRKPFKRLSTELSTEETFNENIILLKYEESPETIFVKNEDNKKYKTEKENLRKALLTIFTKKEKEIFFLLENGGSIENIAFKMGYKHKNAVYTALRRMQEKAEKAVSLRKNFCLFN